MAKRFKPVQRDQLAMLPLNLRDQLPADHVVFFLVDVVESLDLTLFERRSKLGGAGREPFDPAALLTVLVYGYALGERSTRQLERLCGQDIAFMFIMGGGRPDHTTLARFRQIDPEAFEDLFAQVLVLLHEAGLVKLGTIAIDGTKIAANAAMSANAGEDKLRETIRRITEEAAAVDAAEDERFGDARGDEVPPQWADPSGRKERIRKLKERMEEEQRRRDEADDQERTAAEWEQRNAQAPRRGKIPKKADRVKAAERSLERVSEYEERRYQLSKAARDGDPRGDRRPGMAPVPTEQRASVVKARARLEKEIEAAAALAAQPPGQEPAPSSKAGKVPKFRVNLTDPDSRLMKTRNGWIQGYNCQLAVTGNQIILAVRTVTDGNDVGQFVPMMNAVEAIARFLASAGPAPADGAAAEQIGTILADAGYWSENNLTEPGPDRLIPGAKQNDTAKSAAENPAEGPPPPQATPKQAMAWKLRTPEGISAYGKRKETVEPVNSHLKDITAMRRVSRRGQQAAHSELTFAAAVLNLLKLHRHQLA